jgi:uncharacterized protein (DUF608 family)
MMLAVSSCGPAQKTELRTFSGANLAHVAFPMGGFGAGMICLEGSGGFNHVSLGHAAEVYNDRAPFAAVCALNGDFARVLEGPVPKWKIYGPSRSGSGTANGVGHRHYGYPRFSAATFTGRFPFGQVELRDPGLPIQVQLCGWSPLVPGNSDDSSLPTACLEYRITNSSDQDLSAVFSFHVPSMQHVKGDLLDLERLPNGVVMTVAGGEEAHGPRSLAALLDRDCRVDLQWFQGGWFDTATMLWRTIESGEMPQRDPEKAAGNLDQQGASLFAPLEIAAGASETVGVSLCWHQPAGDLKAGCSTSASCGCENEAEAQSESPSYVPWYAERFTTISQLVKYWEANRQRLRRASRLFSDTFFASDLPAEVIEAVAANLSILKTPTCLRQHDGRFWAWEGCCDGSGCCYGSCNHVWNYAQALPHLFPDLERSMRETEFGQAQSPDGAQAMRVPLPIGPPTRSFGTRTGGKDRMPAAADGQLGSIVRAYREWRISGDTDWVRGLWPGISSSLEFCIRLWDPDRAGVLVEPQHNTYDIQFWGPNGMCQSIYLAALQAVILIGRQLGEDLRDYSQLLEGGKSFMEQQLFDGEYFVQKTRWQELQEPFDAKKGTAAEQNLAEREGPKYQYGSGCLSDGVIGQWLAGCAGLGDVLDPQLVKKHLQAVYRHNFRRDLSGHVVPQRPGYALADEAGLLLCSWPKGGKPALPFVYSNEVWTGIEYQVAAHLIMLGEVEKGLEIIRTLRSRYDGAVRNPFDEYECGHWYARALASYSLLQAISGARYDAVEKRLYLKPKLAGDFRCFLATASGYGTVGVRSGQPFLDVASGEIEINGIEYEPFAS